MPELPEVETVRRGLEPVLEGARLSRVKVNRPDLRFPFPDDFAARLEGAVVERLERRAKYLRFHLDTGETWVTHLGMTGRFTIDGQAPGEFEDDAPTGGKHEHLSLTATRNGAPVRIGFSDARRFGYMALIPTGDLDDHAWFRALGPEPLGNGFNAGALKSGFRGRRQNVKVTLLDQTVVAGVGNIYACEALYRARISPSTPAGRLGPARLERLTTAVREVLQDAVEAGGSTLRDFANAEGGQGYFQHRFDVYGREGQACAHCAAEVRRTMQAGRSTFWCPRCQT